MLSFRNLFLVLALLFFLGGMAALLSTQDQSSAPLPRLPPHPTPSVAPPTPTGTVAELLGPWAVPPSPRRVVDPRPAPVIPPSDPVIDRMSVRYLGTLTGEGDQKTYLFKFLPNGKALTLIEGVDNQGWRLAEVTPTQFSLRGPGGLYAVVR